MSGGTPTKTSVSAMWGLLLRITTKRVFATVKNTTFTHISRPVMAATAGVNANTSKVILAPMVRTGELPTRLLSLQYGADMVYGPETVDKAIIGCKRIINKRTGTIDFVKPAGGTKRDQKVIFRTLPEKESGRIVFQMGTASAELAVEAAKVLVARGDEGEREGGTVVAGVDVNSGCPKHFSIHAGMGAALLGNPDNLVSILTSLVTQIGTPFSIPISVKIRLLEPPEETLPLVERLCATGIYRLTLHCRTIPQRPRDPVTRGVLSAVANICRAAGIECIANGDVLDRTHALQLCEEYGVDGCMIARAAETNMSVFRAEGPLPWREVAEQFVRTAVKVESHFSNTKYVLGKIVPGKERVYQLLHRAKTHEQMCEILGIQYEPPAIAIIEETAVASASALTVGEEKTVNKAVEKARAGNSTARAAGDITVSRKEGKKLSERGVGSAANIAAAAAIANRDTQYVLTVSEQATAVV